MLKILKTFAVTRDNNFLFIPSTCFEPVPVWGGWLLVGILLLTISLFTFSDLSDTFYDIQVMLKTDVHKNIF